MFAAIKESWKDLKSSEPGRRFQDRYERRKKENRGSFHWGRWLNIAGGLLLTLVGLFLLPAPGPGMLVVIGGLSLLGSEFLTLAKFMDWAEVRLRKVATWGRRWWSHAGTPARTLVILVACLLAAGVAYGGYVWFTH